MSLGTWFRDYVYIPLGGSRCGTLRNMLNLFIVWCLTGLWHGAEWTFVAWGLYFGVLLIIEKQFLYKWLQKTKIAGHVYACVITLFSFVIFDAVSLNAGMETLGKMFGAGSLPVINGTTLYYLGSYAVIFVIAILGATPLPKLLTQKLPKSVLSWVEPIVMAMLLLVVTGYLVDGSFNPFLYFRF